MAKDIPCPAYEGDVCDHPESCNCDYCDRMDRAMHKAEPFCHVRETICRHDPPHDCENCKVWQPGDICWVATYQEFIPLATPIVIDEVGETTVAAHWYAPYDTQLDPFEVDHESFSKKELFPTMERCLAYLKRQLESYAAQNAGHLLIHLRSNNLEDDLAWKLLDVAAPVDDL